MEINLKRDLGIGNTRHILDITNTISNFEINDNHVVLSFEDCLTQYPAAGTIISTILHKLEKKPGPKILEIIQSYQYPTLSTILNNIFLGCDYLGLIQETPLTEQEIKDSINKSIYGKQISIKLYYKEIYDLEKTLLYSA